MKRFAVALPVAACLVSGVLAQTGETPAVPAGAAALGYTNGPPSG
jgi:hypothetical protein